MTLSVDRRGFFKVSAAGAALVLGFYLPPANRVARAAAEGPFAPNAFIRVAEDGNVTVIVNKSEMGQGVYTALPMMVAEELECDWGRVRVEFAPAHPDYYHTQWGPMQGTGGSSSVNSTWDQLRRAGATARAMLVEAAARQWGVPAAECQARDGVVSHGASGRSLGFGALAAGAAQVPVPEEVPLKAPAEFRLIGRPVKRLDTPAKVNGQAVFGLDVRVPGMRTAVIARPPVFGATVAEVNDQAARAVKGVREVLVVDAGVAVVADDTWSALKGRRALEVRWDESTGTVVSSGELWERYRKALDEPGLTVRGDGDAAGVLSGAARRVEAVYELPYLAHATMEPLNCLAHVQADGCDVWTGTQLQTVDQAAAAEVTGLAPESVRIHTQFLGGGFGRRANPRADFVREAVQVAKTAGGPVKVVWTREDDTRGGYYRPMHLSRLAAALDEAGMPVAWDHHLVGESVMKGTPFAGMIQDGVDPTAVEGAVDVPYGVPNVHVVLHPMDNGLPVLWWRSVGHSYTAFAVESFLDELAAAAGRDPLEYRLALLKDHPRHRALLELVAERAGWGTALPEGHGRGIAIHESFKSLVAEVAEVSLGPGGRPRVHRVVCAVDCGQVVNPDTVQAQMESAVAFALSAVLDGAVTLEAGRVQQSNFHDYPILRMGEMPRVEVHIAKSTAEMGGIGEPGVPPLAPAVANGLFAATGRRIRRLPMGRLDAAA